MIEDLLLELVMGYVDGRMPQSYYISTERFMQLRDEYMRVTKMHPFPGQVPYSFKILTVDIAPIDVLKNGSFALAPIPYGPEWTLAGVPR